MGWPKGVPFSAEHRARMSASRKGVTKSPEHKAKIAAAHRGKTVPQHLRDQIAAKLQGRTLSPEHAAKSRETIKAAHASSLAPEVRSRAAETQRKRRMSDEQKAHLSRLNTGKRLSEETKAKIGAWGRGRPASYPMRRFYYKDVPFRSTWEVRAAKAMDALGIRWEFESRRFDLGEETYAPDFYLPDDGAYWEVKGYFGPQSQKTIGLFRGRYPDIPLVLLTERGLRLLEQAVATKAA
jgi:hypothetical protein